VWRDFYSPRETRSAASSRPRSLSFPLLSHGLPRAVVSVFYPLIPRPIVEAPFFFSLFAGVSRLLQGVFAGRSFLAFVERSFLPIPVSSTSCLRVLFSGRIITFRRLVAGDDFFLFIFLLPEESVLVDAPSFLSADVRSRLPFFP